MNRRATQAAPGKAVARKAGPRKAIQWLLLGAVFTTVAVSDAAARDKEDNMAKKAKEAWLDRS